jgi:hypothetical protein
MFMAETNGLRAERKLLDYLEQLGFRLKRTNGNLDERDKIDAIIEAPPLLRDASFYPPAVALQITLRREDTGKRHAFVSRARTVAQRLVYLELMVEEMKPAVAHAAAAALNALFYDEGPRYRLLVVGENVFEQYDLEEADNQVRQWLETRIDGQLSGRVVRWHNEGQYGFIAARVATGPDGSPAEVEFYFNGRQVREDGLRQQLASRSDSKQRPSRQIPVVFTDGGITGDQKNKNAHNVRPAPSAA